MTEPRLITLRQLAEYLSVGDNTVRRMVARGDLPKPIRIGGVMRFDKAAIDKMLDDKGEASGRFADLDEALAD